MARDLYLELHRGTYTTHARNKRHNRKAEILYREAELWNSVAFPSMDNEKKQGIVSELHDGWKLILLNQFHDIIPGSAITESYVTSEKEYAEVFQKGNHSLISGFRYWRTRPIQKGKAFRMLSSTDLDGEETPSSR